VKLNLEIILYLKERLSYLKFYNICKNKSIDENILKYLTENVNYSSDFLIEIFENIPLNSNLIETYCSGHYDESQDDPVYYIDLNPTLTVNLIRKYKDRLDWLGLSVESKYVSDPNFVTEFVSYIYWENLSNNSYLNLQSLRQYNVSTKKYPDGMWNWADVSTSFTITLDIIIEFDKPQLRDTNIPGSLDFPNGRWNFKQLCYNKFLTKDIIEHYINKFNWNSLSFKTDIDIKILKEFNIPRESHPNGYWDWDLLSNYQELNLEKMREFSKPQYKNLEIVGSLDFPNGRWNWNKLYLNKYLTYEIIKEFEDKIRNWNSLDF
jgi:hypothetical protein